LVAKAHGLPHTTSRRFVSILQSSKNIVAIAGAGLSAASGLAFNCISLRISDSVNFIRYTHLHRSRGPLDDTQRPTHNTKSVLCRSELFVAELSLSPRNVRQLIIYVLDKKYANGSRQCSQGNPETQATLH